MLLRINADVQLVDAIRHPPLQVVSWNVIGTWSQALLCISCGSEVGTHRPKCSLSGNDIGLMLSDFIVPVCFYNLFGNIIKERKLLVYPHKLFYKCLLCLDDTPQESFAAFNCGHGVCIDCLQRIVDHDVCLLCSSSICAVTFLGHNVYKNSYTKAFDLTEKDMFLHKSTGIVYRGRHAQDANEFLRHEDEYRPMHATIIRVCF